ncbi:MAG: hypothetical protein A2161_04625 [Candidatus Schekmanbacteria bacterium RBG_13_48_7]|uniref:YbhG-like alpha-helical hairpin domain-containing protein n=1 Tax=Candidatus Schekmanbacteria bacterium RBG_13_48_7 TaxID=1817878 RepID=A0A1F7RN53_9BACT|nr:MAG: hypothetical protein A2161_04625 [Candidatus Schekmanbacteria bacterium RBG_13_48_7]
MRVVIIPAFILLLIVGCSQNTGEIVYSGLFEATEINLSSPESGKLVSFPYEEGDILNSGQVVGQLDKDRFEIEKSGYMISIQELDVQKIQSEAMVSLTKVTLEGAEREYNRLKNLYAKKSATEQQLDNAKTARDQASAQLKANEAALKILKYKKELFEKNIQLVEKRITDCTIISPINGTMIKKYFEETEVVPGGAPIGKIADLTTMKLMIYIAQEDLGRIKIGDKLPIRVDSYPEKRSNGSVAWISDKSEFTPKNVQTREARSEMVFAVKLLVENTDNIFKIGMPAEVLWKN